jgi:hypothetical protein
VIAIGGVLRRNKTGQIRVTNRQLNRIAIGVVKSAAWCESFRAALGRFQLWHISAMQGNLDHDVP